MAAAQNSLNSTKKNPQSQSKPPIHQAPQQTTEQSAHLGLDDAQLAMHDSSMAGQSAFLSRLHPPQRMAMVQRMTQTHGNAQIGRIIARTHAPEADAAVGEPTMLQQTIARYGMENLFGAADGAVQRAAFDGAAVVQRESVEDVVHVVTDEDTLYSLAKKYNVTIQAIIDANPDLLVDGEKTKLQIGWELKIPTGGGEPAEESSLESMSWTMVGKDNLWQLSIRLGVKWEDLKKANPHLDPEALQENQPYTVFIPEGGSLDGALESMSWTKTAENSLWQLAEALGVKWDALKAVNPDLDPQALQVGETYEIVIPAGATPVSDQQVAPPPSADGLEIAGDPNGTKVMRVAWTIDDGPTRKENATEKMKQELAVNGVTWYVVKERLGSGETYNNHIRSLQEIQANGGEIALHDDVNWWFEDIDSHMGRMKDFRDELAGHGIHAYFVRPHGGIYSQLRRYLESLGFSKGPDGVANKYARQILDEDKRQNIQNSRALEVASSYQGMKKALSEMDVMLWGGQSDYRELPVQSWHGQADDTKTTASANFERMASRIEPGQSRNYVILTHDRRATDAVDAGSQKDLMETFASDNGVKIEYHTMSSLFEASNGAEIETFDVRY